jgi:hypothetical protein
MSDAIVLIAATIAVVYFLWQLVTAVYRVVTAAWPDKSVIVMARDVVIWMGYLVAGLVLIALFLALWLGLGIANYALMSANPLGFLLILGVICLLAMVHEQSQHLERVERTLKDRDRN